jgi:membrane associated rhomboid family serine protease
VPIFIYPLFVDLPAIVFLGFWFVSQLFSGVLSFGLPENVGGVAWWAHIGGFLAGMLLCGLFSRRDRRMRSGPTRHYVLPQTHARRRPPVDGL